MIRVCLYFGIGLLLCFITGLVEKSSSKKTDEGEALAAIFFTLLWPLVIPVMCYEIGREIKKAVKKRSVEKTASKNSP
jgi:hypothetical protein